MKFVLQVTEHHYFLRASASILNSQVAHTFSEAFEELLDMYADIGESLPMFEQYETLFRDAAYPHMRAVLELVYKDVMKFHHQAYKYFRQRGK